MSEPEEENSSPYWRGLFDRHKVPLLFLFLGLLLFGGGFFYLFADRPNSPEVIIKHSNNDSANKANSSLIKVDIGGAVKKPGLVELTANSRLQEALIKAGGFTQKADALWIGKNLNLAAKLIDGQKIYIPSREENYSSLNNQNIPSAYNSGLVNINAALAGELEELPGVGEVTAQKIIDNRPYESVEQLLEKKIIGQSVFEKIKDKISLY